MQGHDNAGRTLDVLAGATAAAVPKKRKPKGKSPTARSLEVLREREVIGLGGEVVGHLVSSGDES